MKRFKKVILLLTSLATVAVAGAGLYYGLRLASIAAAYKAKILCSGVFVSNREASSILDRDLATVDSAVLRRIDARIDKTSKEVTADLFGVVKRKAAYRQGFGCSLAYDASGGTAGGKAAAVPAASSVMPEEYAPQFEAALDWAFSEPDPARLRLTRAAVIVHDGKIVAERYARGFGRETPLLGWSMTKSVINALAGIMVKEGRLSLDGPPPVPEWQAPGDPRRKITLDHLLRMTSGLRFEEDYADPLKDVTFMLFGVPDAAAYAAQKPLDAEPGAKWHYSSGTTNIISRIIRHAAGDAGYADLPGRALFGPLGMNSAVIERDASGTFLGSSFMYATARDWAKFGQLYLQDGAWAGRRILPEGWVKYTATPAPRAPEGRYGAHFWLKLPKVYLSPEHAGAVPADALHAVGHEGQFVSIIPSLRLVVVRLGLSPDPTAWKHDRFLDLIIKAVGDLR